MLYSGKLIENIRKSQGISQEELAEGLCSKVHLFHIEAGEREAEKLLFESLYQRLGKYSGRYETLLDNDEYILQERRWKICELIDDGQYNDAINEIKDYRNLTEDVIHRQYLSFIECEAMQRKGESIELCMSKLKEAIAYTRTDFKLDRIEAYYLSRMEMLIIEQYVRYMELSGDVDEAISYYHRIIKILDREYFDRSERNLQGRYASYWLMQYYFEHEKYDMALEIGEKAWKYNIGNNYIVSLAEIKECIICCKEALGMDMSAERKELRILKGFNKKFGVMSAKDYFPRYVEKRVYNVNDIIRQRRYMNKMTQEQLASDICEVTSIWRMEKGKTTLQKENKEKLLKLIKLSGDKYIAHVDTSDINVFKCLNKISDAMYSGSLDEATKLIEILEEANIENELNTRQYIAMKKYTIKVIQGIAGEEDIENHIKLLAERGVDVTNARLKKVILLNNEYALLYAVIKYYEREEKRYDKCFAIVEQLIETYDDTIVKHSDFICIAVKTIAGDILGEMKQIDTANKHLIEGLKISAKRDILSHIRGITEIYAWNLLEENDNISIQDKEDSKKFLEYAYVMAKLYGNATRAKKATDMATKYEINLDI